MKITALKIKNFKVFQNLELTNLPPLAVFVGANGAGKTTLFDILSFIRDSLNHNVRHALAMRGGFNQVRSRDQSGDIEIELQFRLPIAGEDRLVAYHLTIGEENAKPIVAQETLSYADKAENPFSPFSPLINFAKGRGSMTAQPEESEQTDGGESDMIMQLMLQNMDSPDILALKGLGQFSRFQAASALRAFIENWHVSNFHISAAHQSGEAGHHEHLSPKGDNLPMVAQYMREHHPDQFNAVLKKMEQRVPGIQQVQSETTQDGRVLLKFQDGAFKDPFIAKHVSDGTIKMFAYLLLLHDPAPHPMLCIEEPENQLYPYFLDALLEEFRLYAERGGQLFLSTHSPDLLNAARPEEVFWLVKKDGYTAVKNAASDEELVAFCQEGDKLGRLWQQNYFKNCHPGW